MHAILFSQYLSKYQDPTTQINFTASATKLPNICIHFVTILCISLCCTSLYKLLLTKRAKASLSSTVYIYSRKNTSSHDFCKSSSTSPAFRFLMEHLQTTLATNIYAACQICEWVVAINNDNGSVLSPKYRFLSSAFYNRE